MHVTVSSKGQTVIPVKFRKEFGLQPEKRLKISKQAKNLSLSGEESEFDTVAAVESARVRGELEKAGQGPGRYDTLIAGHCRANGRTLLSNNTREFKWVKNLKVRSV